MHKNGNFHNENLLYICRCERLCFHRANLGQACTRDTRYIADVPVTSCPVSGNTLGSLSLKTADSAKQLPCRAAGQCVATGDADLSTKQRMQVTDCHSNTVEQHATKLAIVGKQVCIGIQKRRAFGRSEGLVFVFWCSGVPVCCTGTSRTVRDAGCVGKSVNIQLWAV